MLIVTDLDQTIADYSHRLPSNNDFSLFQKEDWDKFFSREIILWDTPIPFSIPVLRYLHNEEEIEIVYITGREYRSLSATQEWMKLYGIPVPISIDPKRSEIFARTDNDVRSPVEVKQEILEKYVLPIYGEEEEKIAVDDDNQILSMYKHYGFKVYHPSQFWINCFEKIVNRKKLFKFV